VFGTKRLARVVVIGAVAAAGVGGAAAATAYAGVGTTRTAATDAATSGTAAGAAGGGFAFSGEKNIAFTVTVTGGPEGKRSVNVPAGGKQHVGATVGKTYHITARTADGKVIGDFNYPAQTEGADCFTDMLGSSPALGCVAASA
jgi:hypothetical protein